MRGKAAFCHPCRPHWQSRHQSHPGSLSSPSTCCCDVKGNCAAHSDRSAERMPGSGGLAARGCCWCGGDGLKPEGGRETCFSSLLFLDGHLQDPTSLHWRRALAYL